MGHIRLGTIPKSRAWTAVVESLARSSASATGPMGGSFGDPDEAEPLVDHLAKKALIAARSGLTRAKKDEGLRHTFYLLTQVALASRNQDWLDRLQSFGIHLSAESSILDLTTEFQGAIDGFLRQGRGSSDISEMAQRAAGDALTVLAGPKAETLFGSAGEELRLAVRSFSTKAGFGRLGQAFFGRLMSRFLNFYLSRLTASKLGTGSFQQVGDISAFNSALENHCLESAQIVHDFAAEWYSKTEYVEGISTSNAGAFVAVALEKLTEELRRQETER